MKSPKQNQDTQNESSLVFLEPKHFGIKITKNNKLMIRLSRGTALLLDEKYIARCFENAKKGAA